MFVEFFKRSIEYISNVFFIHRKNYLQLIFSIIVSIIYMFPIFINIKSPILASIAY